jgi:hypothetical protein
MTFHQLREQQLALICEELKEKPQLQVPRQFRLASTLAPASCVDAMKFLPLVLQLLSVTLFASAAVPGRMAVWKVRQKDESGVVQHHTLSVSAHQAAEHIHRTASDGSLLVVVRSLSSVPGELLAQNEVASEIRTSQSSQVFSYVHRSAQDGDKNIAEYLFQGRTVRSAPLSTAVQQLQEDNSFVEQVLDVTVDASEVSLLPKLFEVMRKRNDLKDVSFVVVEEPSADAVMPAERANYARLLSGDGSKDDGTSAPTVSPAPAPIAGAEFSIYYNGAYLYITPDIFTGLMTALFMVGVALTGLSCMGSIQGMSSFYDRVPSNGREA